MKKPLGSFMRVWFGQLLSVIGTAMTQYALAIWLWNQTGEVTTVVITTTFFFLPTVFLGPFAGALIDRWNRKRLMLCCDMIAGLVSLLLFILFKSGSLQTWHIYVAAILSGIFQCVQVPALMASVSTLVPEDHYSKGVGLLGLSDTLSQILAPALAGLLYAIVGVGGTLIIDIVTFVIGIVLMLSVPIPNPQTSEIGQQSKGSFFQEGLFGFRFVIKHRNLLYLLLFMILVNVVLELWATFLSPMILARTGNSSLAVGWVQGAGGVGAVIGGIILSRIRSPKNYVPPMLFALGLMSVFTLPIGFKNSLPWWLIAHFSFFFIHAFLGAYHQSIWQSKVPPDVQGRVFAVRRLTFGVSALFAPALLGQLADHVFVPAIGVSGHINTWFSWLVGSQPGDGIAAMFILGNIVLLALAIVGYLVPALRSLDIAQSDHQSAPQPAIA
jgi:MFS transporter, DHA3 family, macrolide efflux protein